jgi:hypothetical protein
MKLARIDDPTGPPPEVMQPADFGDTFEVQQTTGAARLAIGPTQGFIGLMKSLLRDLEGPYYLLYVLGVPRTGEHEPGRYQSPTDLDRFEVFRFLDQFTDFLEQDARHNIWVHSIAEEATLVYDKHQIIYAYGPLERFQRVIQRRMKPGEVGPNFPHAHLYHAEFVDDERRVRSAFEWIHSPLCDGDD